MLRLSRTYNGHRNYESIYWLARTRDAHKLKLVIDELNASCVDYAKALDG